MPTFGPNDKPHIDITSENEFEVEFVLKTPVLDISVRHYDPAYPNRLMAGRDKVSLSGLNPDNFEGRVQGYELAFHLQAASLMVKQITALGPRAFLNDNRHMVRR